MVDFDNLSDEELDLMLKKGKYHAPRTEGGQKPTLDTMSDEELDALLSKHGGSAAPAARTGRDPVHPSDFALSDYAGTEDKRGPVTDAVQRQLPADTDLKGAGVPRFEGDNRGSPEDEARNFALFSMGMLAPMAIAPAMKAAGAGHMVSNAVAGGGGGALQTAAGGGDPTDILMAAGLGAAGSAALGGRGSAPARAPRTQAEIDAAALKAVPDRNAYRRPDLPKGSRGTEQMATDLEGGIHDELTGRQAARKGKYDAAENAARDDLQGLRHDAQPEIDELESLRTDPARGFAGARGPINQAADARMADAQQNLSRPEKLADAQFKEYVHDNPNLTFDELNNVRKFLNHRLSKASNIDLGTVGDELSAGIVSGATRRMDAEQGGGKFGQALDDYAAEGDQLKRGNAQLYDRASPEAPDEIGAREAGRSRLGRAGQVTVDDQAASHMNERRLGEVEGVLGQKSSGSPLIDQIRALRARNTDQRRSMFTAPTMLSSNPLVMGARTLQHNASNMNFKLNRPNIDDMGMVAAREAGSDAATMPLELQLMLMQLDQKRRQGERQ
jgi:hypothetical protein